MSNTPNTEEMAEPLSTLASVIALCQATAAIYRGSRIIAGLQNVPSEFHDLLNGEVRPNSPLPLDLGLYLIQNLAFIG